VNKQCGGGAGAGAPHRRPVEREENSFGEQKLTSLSTIDFRQHGIQEVRPYKGVRDKRS